MDQINPSDLISTHFTYKEALWLPSWGRMGNENDGLNDEILARLKYMFQKMDTVRDYFGQPINVHVAWRPQKYNALVKGAPDSAHRAQVDHSGLPLKPDAMEAAVDFDVQGMSCEDARQMIIRDNKLEEWGLRMEDNGVNANWIHLDCRTPLHGHPRFFKV